MRRTTLGPVSNSNANTRHSMAPPRLSSVKPATKPRNSSIGSRASIASARPSYAPSSVQDSRKVGSKEYRDQCIALIIDFLNTHNCEFKVSPKALTTPLNRDFISILQFLVDQIDPNYRVQPNPKFDDAAITTIMGLFRKLRYPFNISKSQLQSIGSPHTWPPLLAALAWIVELLQYEERAGGLAALGFEPNGNILELMADANSAQQIPGERIFFEYLVHAYRNFIHADESQPMPLDTGLSELYEQRNRSIQTEIERLTHEIADGDKELHSYTSSVSPLIELSKRKQAFLTDIEKYKEFIKALQTQHQQTQRLTEEQNAAIELKENELKKSLQEKQKLQVILDAQEISPADVLRMNNERNKLEEALSTLTNRKDELLKSNWDAEVEINTLMSNLDTSVKTYNLLGSTRLKIIPRTAKNADGVEYELIVNRNGTTPAEIINLDLKRSVKPNLLKLKNKFSLFSQTAQQELLTVKEKLGTMEEQRQDKADDIAALETQLDRLTTTFNKQKESVVRELQQRVADTEEVEKESHRLKSLNTEMAVAESQRNLELLQQHYAALQRKFMQEREVLNDLMLRSLDMLTNHKAYLQENLAKLEARCKQVDLELNS